MPVARSPIPLAAVLALALPACLQTPTNSTQTLTYPILDATFADTATASDTLSDALADTPSDTNSDTLATDTNSPDIPEPDSKSADTAPSPCAGVTCSGHGTCFPVYGTVLCKCDPGFWLLGTKQCLADSEPSPCHPNPCVEPDKAVCTVSGSGASAQAVCGCNPGYSDTAGGCLFVTCPQVAAHTAITIYDQTGAGVAEGFDPLQPGDTVKVRVEVDVLSGSGEGALELQASNLAFDLSRQHYDGKPVLGTQKSTILTVPVALQPGLHAYETLATFGNASMPLGLNARLVGGASCELPQSRSGARIGPLGLNDAKGFGCIDLDRTRSVQVDHDVVEKNTSVYGDANGITADYQPAGSVVSAMVQCVYRQTDRALFLAGDGRATLPWAVDNDLLIEVYDHAPASGDAPVAVLFQGTDQVTSTKGWSMHAGPAPDVPGTHFGIPNGSPFGFSAGHVRLESWVPPFKQTWLRFVALDEGVVGRLTRLYLVSEPAAEAPRRCLSNSQCKSADGQVNAGCVAGQCQGGACGSSCPADQFCVGGFCTSQCNAGGGTCPGGTVCAVRSCVPPGTVGVCGAAMQDQDCPAGQVCHWGRCEPGCHHPRKQDQSYALDPSFCQGNKPALCPHCTEVYQGCWNNVCSACEIDAHCGFGMLCVNRMCVAP